ncbi:hypothetical protein [Pseudalkalibacillus decolorationis]|uniref:hypothetical protein n=1 Tax=Pseudalkalibacillus decolorationis TaxID=163879 RepID=UPI00214981DB|nr:hypothetical protein [Pseudalkalibacillus decolorationis]
MLVFVLVASTASASSDTVVNTKAESEKVYTIESFYYLNVDGKDVDAKSKVNTLSNNNIKVTMVLPKQNKNGDWLAYGFTSMEDLQAFIEKDKQRLQNNNKFKIMGSGTCCTDFYEYKNKGGQYIYWRDGFKNLPSSWNDRISSLSTASPSASYSTTLWQHTSYQGYGRGVLFRHSDWYGKTANMASDWNNVASAIDINY